MYKAIKQIIPSQKVNMDGHFMDQPLPIENIHQHDPFLLIHHWNNPIPAHSHQRNVGVGPHPHRGFSPITFVFKGSVHHRDSRGNENLVEAGGVQWMNAGMGITHSERPGKDFAEQGGDFEIIQFWLNAPSQHKMLQPEYQAVHLTDIPKFEAPDKLTIASIISGEQFGLTGPVKHRWPVLIMRLDFKKGGEIEFDVPSGFNALLYNLDGNLTINDSQRCFMKDMTLFENDSNQKIKLNANDVTRAIFLAGLPINEQVEKYGPFVMNTQTEIMEALRDSKQGKMGILIENF